jgi:hypothetical protein
MDDLPILKPNTFSFTYPSKAKPRFKPLTKYDSIKSQLSSRSFIQKYKTATLDGEFQTFPNSDDELPHADRIKSKIWKGFSGRNHRDYLRDSTYGGILEDLEAFKEARTIKREMEDIVSESNEGDRVIGQ